MPAYSDIYVISKNRDSISINKFLDHFIPNNEESAEEYEVPQYSENSEFIFTQAQTLILMCEQDTSIVHSIYWRNTSGTKPEHAMVFYLEDGHVIYGLSTDVTDTLYVNNLFDELKQFLNSPIGYIGFEEPPNAENINEFKLQIESHKT